MRFDARTRTKAAQTAFIHTEFVAPSCEDRKD